MEKFQDEEVTTSGSTVKELVKDSVLMLIPVAIIIVLIFSFF